MHRPVAWSVFYCLLLSTKFPQNVVVIVKTWLQVCWGAFRACSGLCFCSSVNSWAAVCVWVVWADQNGLRYADTLIWLISCQFTCTFHCRLCSVFNGIPNIWRSPSINQNSSGSNCVNHMWIRFLLPLSYCQTAMSHPQRWLATEKWKQENQTVSKAVKQSCVQVCVCGTVIVTCVVSVNVTFMYYSGLKWVSWDGSSPLKCCRKDQGLCCTVHHDAHGSFSYSILNFTNMSINATITLNTFVLVGHIIKLLAV